LAVTTPQKPSSIGTRSRVAGLGILLGLAALAYWPSFHAEFVWDDWLLLKSNPLVSGELTLRSVWFQTDFPLSTTVFWLEWLAFAKQPLGYHLVNLLLHAGSVLLVWRLLARLKVRGAWLAAALFAVHPVCVASVAWISEIKNTLSLPFFLLSLLCYLQSEENSLKSEVSSLESGIGNRGTRETDSTERSTLHVPSILSPPSSLLYPLSFLFFLLALLSKTSTVMLPVVLLLSAWWQRGRLQRSDWLRTGPFFVLSLLFGLLTVWFQSHQAFTTATVQTENLWGRLAGAGLAVWFYLGKALLPLNLNAIYPRWQIDATSLLAWLPILALVGVFLLCWILGRTSDRSLTNTKSRPILLSPICLSLVYWPRWPRHLFFGLGCFVVLLFPALGFFDMYFLALSRVGDQFQYLALIAILALVAALLTTLTRLPVAASDKVGQSQTKSDGGTLQPQTGHAPRTTHHVSRLLCLLILATLTLLTILRARTWASNEALWRDTLAKNPAAWTAHNNLGCLLAEQQRYDQALTHFAASVQFNPANADAHANLGQALTLMGRFPEAEPHFRTALQLKPDSANAHSQFASALAAQGRLAEALPHFRQALRLQPSTPLRQQYAALLYQAGHPREAVAQLRQALAAQPEAPEILNNLAWLLATSAEATLRNGPEAISHAERACQLTQSQQPFFLATLAAAYAEAGRFPEAVATAEQAREVARAAQQESIASQIEGLLKLYRGGTAYHEGATR
jgi:protein O-mannosyl-transferase